MNALVSFRLCTLSDEELVRRVDQLTDEMYQTGKIPSRHIPARPNEDYDLLVGELCKRFFVLTEALQKDKIVKILEQNVRLHFHSDSGPDAIEKAKSICNIYIDNFDVAAAAIINHTRLIDDETPTPSAQKEMVRDDPFR